LALITEPTIRPGSFDSVRRLKGSHHALGDKLERQRPPASLDQIGRADQTQQS